MTTETDATPSSTNSRGLESSSARSSAGSETRVNTAEALQAGFDPRHLDKALDDIITGGAKRRGPENGTRKEARRPEQQQDADEGTERESREADEAEGRGRREESRSDGERGSGGDDRAALDPEQLDERRRQQERAEGQEGEGKRLRELAKDLDVATDELYRMKVPLGDGSGRHLSVEELKAAYGERDALAEAEAQFELKQIEAENKVVRARTELQQLAGFFNKYVPAKQLAEARAQMQQAQQAEAQRLLQAMPQLQKPGEFAALQSRAEEYLAGYGYSRAEVRAISDHRLYRLLDASMRMAERIKTLEGYRKGEGIKPPKTTKRKSSGQPSGKKAALTRARQPGATREDQLAGVTSIIMGD